MASYISLTQSMRQVQRRTRARKPRSLALLMPRLALIT